MSDLLDLEEVTSVMPRNLRTMVTQEMIDNINNLSLDAEFREQYKANIISYTSVMKEGRFKMSNYLDAVRYVSFKLLGDENITAYCKTFPAKYSAFLARGVTGQTISSYVHAYHSSKLVQLIMGQTMTPTYVLNADLYQKALNVQADLMMTANSEKVRSDAANSILTHLKPPETAKIDISVGLQGDSVIQALRESTQRLVNQQRAMIEQGSMDAQQIAHTKLVVEGEFEEIR
jgi:hypothetical protein